MSQFKGFLSNDETEEKSLLSSTATQCLLSPEYKSSKRMYNVSQPLINYLNLINYLSIDIECNSSII